MKFCLGFLLCMAITLIASCDNEPGNVNQGAGPEKADPFREGGETQQKAFGIYTDEDMEALTLGIGEDALASALGRAESTNEPPFAAYVYSGRDGDLYYCFFQDVFDVTRWGIDDSIPQPPVPRLQSIIRFSKLKEGGVVIQPKKWKGKRVELDSERRVIRFSDS